MAHFSYLFNINKGTKKENTIFIINIISVNYKEIGEFFLTKKVLTE